MIPPLVLRPSTLREALHALGEGVPETRVVAGGTDLLVETGRGIRPAQRLIDLGALAPELRFVREDDHRLTFGALTTHNDVLADPRFRRHALPLVHACAEVGAPPIRTRATVAGNVVTASPANDTIAALAALDAEVEVIGASGTRRLPIDAFVTGFRTTALRPDELVRAIAIPLRAPTERGIFLKLGLRSAQAIAVVNVAVVLDFDGTRVAAARIALGCVAPTVVRAPAAEAALIGGLLNAGACARAAKLAADACAPIDDVRGSSSYRRSAVAALVARALQMLLDGAEADVVPAHPIRLETPVPSRPALPFDGRILTTINGAEHGFADAGHLSLLELVRERAGLSGTKEGCAEGECGACAVWLDGAAVMSCLVPASQAHGARITTIEGLADGERLHPVQTAFVEHGAVQCGYCIPGMIMAAAKALQERPDCSVDEIRTAISGNICRCTGYAKIVAAIAAVSDAAETARLEVPA